MYCALDPYANFGGLAAEDGAVATDREMNVWERAVLFRGEVGDTIGHVIVSIS